MLLDLGRFRAYLHDAGLDAVVLALPVSVAYATEHETSFETTFRSYMFSPGGGGGRFFRSFAVLAADGRRAKVVHAALAATSYLDWDEELIVYGGPGIGPDAVQDSPPHMRALAGALAEPSVDRHPMEAISLAVEGVAPGARRVGVELVGLETGDLVRLAEALPREVQMLDASVLVRLVRMVKTADQIERLTSAAVAGEDGLDAVIEAAAPGVEWSDLLDVFRGVVAKHGAGVDHVAFGPRGLGGGLGNHTLAADDVMMLDVGCVFRSCISDTGVTLSASPPEGACLEEYDHLLAALEAGRAQLVPGAHVLDAYAAMRSAVEGTPAAGSQPQGHGLGQEPKEAPFIAPVSGRFEDECVSVDSNLVFEPGMVINLEVPFEVPGLRSFQVEQSFLVTESGASPLANQPRKQIVTAGSTHS